MSFERDVFAKTAGDIFKLIRPAVAISSVVQGCYNRRDFHPIKPEIRMYERWHSCISFLSQAIQNANAVWPLACV